MRTFLLLLVAVVGLLALSAYGKRLNFAPTHYCGTEEVFQLRYGNFSNKGVGAAACPTEGQCDQASVRDKNKGGSLTIPVVFHIIQTADGKNPNGITLDTIDGAMRQLEQDFSSYGIDFQLLDIEFHPFPSKYPGYSCISAYGSNGDDWFYQIEDIKDAYAVTPNQAINIFVTCQDPGNQGTLLGIGTFPWDPLAITSLGGLWMNSLATGYGLKTLTHEMGHNLGLWHTFHGVSEVTSCRSACYEYAHAFEDPAANSIGDFCSDTAATPRNYECEQPSGADCTKVAWGDTDLENFMSYTPDDCMGQFTNQQRNRMHCWVCDALPGIASGCPSS